MEQFEALLKQLHAVVIKLSPEEIRECGDKLESKADEWSVIADDMEEDNDDKDDDA